MGFYALSSLVNISLFLVEWSWLRLPNCKTLQPPGINKQLYVPLVPPSVSRASIRIA